MADRSMIPSDLPHASSARLSASPPPSILTPSGSPKERLTTGSGLESDEDDDKENNLTAHERLLRSPTDKLLSPVSRALKANKRSPKRGVRMSLTSLLDMAL